MKIKNLWGSKHKRKCNRIEGFQNFAFGAMTANEQTVCLNNIVMKTWT